MAHGQFGVAQAYDLGVSELATLVVPPPPLSEDHLQASLASADIGGIKETKDLSVEGSKVPVEESLPLPVPVQQQGHQRVLPKHCRSALELAPLCRHNKVPAHCHECKRCPHGKQHQECKDCNSSSRRWCPHNKRKHDCKVCSGCPHNKVKRCCKECSGSAVCEHGRLKKNCRECLSASANDKCHHGLARSRCSDCGQIAGSVGAAEHCVGPMVAELRQPPPPPESADGPGGGLCHEQLDTFDEQHRHLTADDGSLLFERRTSAVLGLMDHGQVAMQILSADQVPSSAMPHDSMHIPAGHGIKVHTQNSTSQQGNEPLVPHDGTHDASLLAPAVLDPGVDIVDDDTASLPPLRLCPHGKPKNECGECVKMGTPTMPGAIGQDSGKKRLRDDFGVANSSDMLKTQGGGASGSTGELLSSSLTDVLLDGELCEHNRLRSQCDICSLCRHGRIKNRCRECALCEAHGRLRYDCRECNSGSLRWCPHNKRRHDCKVCSGCPHNRVKRCCKDCNGSAVCPHQRLRKNCRDCKMSQQEQ